MCYCTSELRILTINLILAVSMGRFEVNCINNRGSYYDPHERIQYIGYRNRWRVAEDSAIRRIENEQDSFYVQVDGRQVAVIVSSHNGRKYLKTETDGYAPNNLLNLAECTNCKDIN